ANLILRNEEDNGIGMNSLYNILPNQPFLDEDGNYTSQSSFHTTLNYGRPFREAFTRDSTWLPYDWHYNLKRELDNRDNTINTMDTRLQGGITIRPFGDILTLEGKYQYERGSIRRDMMYNEEMWETRHKVNMYASPTGTHPVPK